jgi:hypothetical protein
LQRSPAGRQRGAFQSISAFASQLNSRLGHCSYPFSDRLTQPWYACTNAFSQRSMLAWAILGTKWRSAWLLVNRTFRLRAGMSTPTASTSITSRRASRIRYVSTGEWSQPVRSTALSSGVRRPSGASRLLAYSPDHYGAALPQVEADEEREREKKPAGVLTRCRGSGLPSAN